ncbi:MAG: guanylate kinase [Alphaproteobacteria bacterium]|nr:guanylate kinase [Alphaproteobacteria bacterium]
MADNQIKTRGTMFVFSGPSGGGKSSVIKRVLQEVKDIKISISVTTRDKREGEVEGEDYYFVSDKKFKQMIKDDAFYEYVDSDFGSNYGTPKEPINKMLAAGQDVILDLDYPGVQQLRSLAGDRVKAIFLMPPSLKILRERLVNRGTDSAEVIERRMSMAEKRINESVFYDYVVVNDILDNAVEEVKAIVIASRVEQKNLVGLDKMIKRVMKDK